MCHIKEDGFYEEIIMDLGLFITLETLTMPEYLFLIKIEDGLKPRDMDLFFNVCCSASAKIISLQKADECCIEYSTVRSCSVLSSLPGRKFVVELKSINLLRDLFEAEKGQNQHISKETLLRANPLSSLIWSKKTQRLSNLMLKIDDLIKNNYTSWPMMIKTPF